MTNNKARTILTKKVDAFIQPFGQENVADSYNTRSLIAVGR